MTAPPPTLINLPPPPSDPVTPSEAPGTPNSTTTSMSELSTVAIKDGHRGHFPHHHHPMDAERADRISRLAGLERLSVRGPNQANTSQGAINTQPPAYFDASNQPQIYRERSTVGSASATGSVGGRTTWASGSDVYDPDRMSEDQDIDVETSSTGGFSDEAASLVAVGEGAGTPVRQPSQLNSPALSKTSASAVPQHLRDQSVQGSPMTGVSMASSTRTSGTTSSNERQRQEAKMIDGMSYDDDVVDTTDHTPPLQPQGSRERTTEQACREREQMRQRQRLGQQGGHMQDSMDVEN